MQSTPIRSFHIAAGCTPERATNVAKVRKGINGAQRLSLAPSAYPVLSYRAENRSNKQRLGDNHTALVLHMGLLDIFRWSRKATTILPTDIVVFLVGPSGSGKSWLLSILLEMAKTRIPVNKGQKPGTTKVYAERCHFEGLQSDIVLVDTPSFYTYEGPNAEKTVKKWIGSNYQKPEGAGILYMHNIASNRLDPNLEVSRHFSAFRRTFPPNLAPSAVHVVPTIALGAILSAERIDTSMTELRRQADNIGASMLGAPFDGRPETAWDVVQELLSEVLRYAN
ncbi:hypothetical protein EDC04DRAFT_2894974 [Pisolithus marmoratus]|nr:hypothetical protein EDC04DRAFT_2894974 [Pisolithus marmoratus]